MEIKGTKYFLISFLLFVIIASSLLFFFSKAEIQIVINQSNTPFFDFFFKNITHLGTGYLLGILFFATIFKNKKFAFKTLLSSILMFGIVLILKLKIFSERPVTFFKYSYNTDYHFHFVNGVNIHNYNSFPSGHTATAFTLFLLLSILFHSKNKILQFVFFALALLVGYSRMYLMQHFLTDVIAGSIIGVVCVYFSNFVINKIFKND